MLPPKADHMDRHLAFSGNFASPLERSPLRLGSASGIRDGPVFRSVNRGGTGGRQISADVVCSKQAEARWQRNISMC